jgi:hypothetical protein
MPPKRKSIMAGKADIRDEEKDNLQTYGIRSTVVSLACPDTSFSPCLQIANLPWPPAGKAGASATQDNLDQMYRSQWCPSSAASCNTVEHSSPTNPLDLQAQLQRSPSVLPSNNAVRDIYGSRTSVRAIRMSTWLSVTASQMDGGYIILSPVSFFNRTPKSRLMSIRSNLQDMAFPIRYTIRSKTILLLESFE